MPLGYCMSCEGLKPIVKAALKLGSRQCEWRPVPHDMRVHACCGSLVDVDDSPDGTIYTCRGCGSCVPEHDVKRVPCDGDKRDIR